MLMIIHDTYHGNLILSISAVILMIIHDTYHGNSDIDKHTWHIPHELNIVHLWSDVEDNT